jgi:hypothetical protein
MDSVINWGLLKHPLNWAIVVLMILIAGAALHFVLAALNSPAE